jgi:phosphoribosylglycinamide formyltransferase 1
VTVRLAVFASGGGSNLQSILDHFHTHQPATARVALVISDRAAAGALQRARDAGIAARVIDARQRDADAIAAETLAALDAEQIGMVALAGYLRRVPAAVVAAFAGRIVNIHPALLPAFGGAGMYGTHVHRAVLAAGCTVTGATVHHVDEEYDRGRVIAQWPVPVLPGDDAERLAARVLAVEHRLYPAALAWLAGRLVAGRTAPGAGTAAGPEPIGTPAAAHFGLIAAEPPAPLTIQSLIREGED